jgi:hypothetical protein
MTTLTIPSLERRLLETVRDEVAAEPVRGWLPGSVQLCLDMLRHMRKNVNEMQEELEKVLAEGVEGQSFARNSTSFLAATDEHINGIRKLVELLTPAKDTASESIAAESRLLEQSVQAFRDLLTKALSQASEAPRSIDISDDERAYLDGLPLSPEAKERVRQFVERFIADIPDEFRVNTENRPVPDSPYFLVQYLIFDVWGDRRVHTIDFYVRDDKAEFGLLLIVFLDHHQG